MPFASDDLTQKRNTPTVALKTSDDFKFGQLVETAKDAMVRELRLYFSGLGSSAARLAEVLTVDKYLISQQSTDPTENMLTLIRQQPDILQKLPLISVTGASGRKRHMGIGGAFVAHTQYPARVRAANASPYNLSAVLGSPAPTITYTTRPDGVNDVVSTIVFASQFFPTPAAVTAQQIANAINFQALYATARAVTASNGSVYLELVAGGPIRITTPDRYPQQVTYGTTVDEVTPNNIEITAGTAALLTALGLTVGQQDDTAVASHPPCNRYALSGDLSLGLDVGATSDNERTEVTDLLIHFLGLYLDDRGYTFYGEHVFTEPITGLTTERFFQIILGDWTMTGEADIPRPDGEREDKVYVNRFTLPVTIIDYIDRTIPSNLIPPTAQLVEGSVSPPENITGVVILTVSENTLAGTGTLALTVAGPVYTLSWLAPGQGGPAVGVDVSAGGSFVLSGGGGTSMAVQVYQAALPATSQTDSITVVKPLPEMS